MGRCGVGFGSGRLLMPISYCQDMPKIPLAPVDFPLPDVVLAKLKERDPIAEHGFGDDVIGSQWWNDKLSQKGLPSRLTLQLHDGQWKLTRGDLFKLGDVAATPGASDDEVLTFLWNVLAWGAGRSQRGNIRRIRSLTEGPQATANVDLLRTSLQAAAKGEPAEAYSNLVRRGGGKIPGLGPAFFTKALYFASEQMTGELRPLILDARVAKNLAGLGWESLPAGRGNYSYNWSTATYVSYCELLKSWAKAASDKTKQSVRPDELELVLFRGV